MLSIVVKIIDYSKSSMVGFGTRYLNPLPASFTSYEILTLNSIFWSQNFGLPISFSMLVGLSMSSSSD